MGKYISLDLFPTGTNRLVGFRELTTLTRFTVARSRLNPSMEAIAAEHILPLRLGRNCGGGLFTTFMFRLVIVPILAGNVMCEVMVVYAH